MVLRCRRIMRIMKQNPQIAVIFVLLTLHTILHFVNPSEFYNRFYTSKQQPLPTRFFSTNSSVIDFPLGQLEDAAELLTQSSRMFVMYYAPWCARSMRARKEFELAAIQCQHGVPFAAVNCWYPNGFCHKHNSFLSFPVLYFYHDGLDGFKYNGPLRHEFMIEFVKEMLDPVYHVTSRDNLSAILSEYDTAVISYFSPGELNQRPTDFYQFFTAALKSIERDFLNVIRYVVLTDGHIASQIGLNDVTRVLMTRSLNYTLRFPVEVVGFNSTLLHQWAFVHRHEIMIRRWYPQISKSLQLSTLLQKNAAVVLLTDILTADNSRIDVFREAARLYRKCENEKSTTTISPHLHHPPSSGGDFITRKRLPLYKDVRSNCRDESETRANFFLPPTLPVRQCCQCLSVPKIDSYCSSMRNNSSDQKLLNNCEMTCDVCTNFELVHPRSLLPCDFDALLSAHLISLALNYSDVCRRFVSNYNPAEFVSVSCQNSKKHFLVIENSSTVRGRVIADSIPIVSDTKQKTLSANSDSASVNTEGVKINTNQTTNDENEEPRKINEEINSQSSEETVSHILTLNKGANPMDSVSNITQDSVDTFTNRTSVILKHVESASKAKSTTSNPTAPEISSLSSVFIDDFLQQLKSGSSSSHCLWNNSKKSSSSNHGWSEDHQSKQYTIDSSLQGLDCQTNKTIRFYAMDWMESYMVAPPSLLADERLGEELRDRIVLVNLEDEAQYVLSEDLSIMSILTFVRNFTQGLLTKTLSSVEQFRNYRGSENKTSSHDINSNPQSGSCREKYVEAGRSCGSSERNEHSKIELNIDVTGGIVEVTSLTFDSIVMNRSQDVLLLYYSPWCGFCSSISHIYLTLARYFSSHSALTIARIDGFRNDLPVPFTVTSYPTIIFFPSHRKSNSVVYPQDRPITLSSLIRFVLSSSQYSTRLRTSLSRCTRACARANLLTTTRSMVLLTARIHRLQETIVTLHEELSVQSAELALVHDVSVAYEILLRDEILLHDEIGARDWNGGAKDLIKDEYDIISRLRSNLRSYHILTSKLHRMLERYNMLRYVYVLLRKIVSVRTATEWNNRRTVFTSREIEFFVTRVLRYRIAVKQSRTRYSFKNVLSSLL